MVLIYFDIDHLIIIDNNLFLYDDKILHTILKHKEIFVIIYPGSYTGIRKSIAICKAIQVINKEIKIYGINILKLFSQIFHKNTFFIEKNIIHFYDMNLKKISLKDKQLFFNDIINDENNIGNFTNNKNNIKLDFSIENVYKYKEYFARNNIDQEYYDKFS